MTILQGGPQAANRPLLLAGKIQFYMGGMMSALDAVKEGIPTVTVAAIFQKDPQILMAHPERASRRSPTSPSCRRIFMGNDGFTTYFQWMKAECPDFIDEQYEPYTFNPAPFLADKESVQQGYLTSEPFAIEKEAGFKPKVFLLADEGYDHLFDHDRGDEAPGRREPGHRPSASSRPRSSAGTTISTATTPPPTR